MIIKLVGKRSFQVQRDKVLGSCREIKDSSSSKICYLDPGFDYEVDDDFGAEMIRRYPMDFAGQNKVNEYKAPAKIEEQPKGKKKKG